MDDLTPLRTLRDDVPAPSADAMTRARVLLNQRIVEEEASVPQNSATRPVPARPRRRFSLRVGGATLVAAAVAAGIVVSTVALPGAGGSAQAAAVLDEAATATVGQTDLVVGTGQYLKIDTTERSAFYLARAKGPGYQWLDEHNSSLYVPADAKAEWVLKDGVRKPVEFFSAGAEKAALEQYSTELAAHPDGETYRGVNGAFGETGPIDVNARIASLPRDPKALLEHFRAEASHSDAETFTLMADTLRSGQAPADLRAALYKAIAKIPGVSVSDRTATIDGKTGVAIGRDNGERRDEIVLDKKTGLLIGERSVLLQDREAMKAGTVVEQSTVTTTVVDEAP